MPIQTRPPETSGPLSSHSFEGLRLGGVTDGMPMTRPGDLLPPGAPCLCAPVPAPVRALALDAHRVLDALRDPHRRPPRWTQDAFGAEVEVVREQLAPVQTRRSLAGSFRREAFHIARPLTAPPDPSPVRLAYALRWIELVNGGKWASWPSLLD